MKEGEMVFRGRMRVRVSQCVSQCVGESTRHARLNEADSFRVSRGKRARVESLPLGLLVKAAQREKAAQGQTILDFS